MLFDFFLAWTAMSHLHLINSRYFGCFASVVCVFVFFTTDKQKTIGRRISPLVECEKVFLLKQYLINNINRKWQRYKKWTVLSPRFSVDTSTSRKICPRTSSQKKNRIFRLWATSVLCFACGLILLFSFGLLSKSRFFLLQEENNKQSMKSYWVALHLTTTRTEKRKKNLCYFLFLPLSISKSFPGPIAYAASCVQSQLKTDWKWVFSSIWPTTGININVFIDEL